MDLRIIVEKAMKIVSKMQAQGLEWEDYHGFLKARLPEDNFVTLAKELGIDPEEYQAEVVEVKSDLSNEVHLHRRAHAHCIVLGENNGFPDAKDALVYLGDAWRSCSSGDAIDIPPGTAHGFTIGEKGTLFFLSVQTPPIKHAEHDDYIRLDIPKRS